MFLKNIADFFINFGGFYVLGGCVIWRDGIR